MSSGGIHLDLFIINRELKWEWSLETKQSLQILPTHVWFVRHFHTLMDNLWFTSWGRQLMSLMPKSYQSIHPSGTSPSTLILMNLKLPLYILQDCFFTAGWAWSFVVGNHLEGIMSFGDFIMLLNLTIQAVFCLVLLVRMIYTCSRTSS